MPVVTHRTEWFRQPLIVNSVGGCVGGKKRTEQKFPVKSIIITVVLIFTIKHDTPMPKRSRFRHPFPHGNVMSTTITITTVPTGHDLLLPGFPPSILCMYVCIYIFQGDSCAPSNQTHTGCFAQQKLSWILLWTLVVNATRTTPPYSLMPAMDSEIALYTAVYCLEVHMKCLKPGDNG